MPRQLIVCVPVNGMPDYPQRAAKECGDSPEVCTQTLCPDCSKAMWLGPRVKALMESGIRATCAYCAILKHHVTNANQVKVLTKEDT